MDEPDETNIEKLQKEIANLKKELFEKKYFYENIIALMPGHVYWLDKNNVYQGCNDLQAKTLKLSSRNDIVGKKNRDLLWKEQAEGYDEANLHVLNTGEVIKQLEEVPVDNKTKTFLTEKIPLKDANNQINGVVGISIDVTKLKETEKALLKAKEKAEAADRAKAEFIANMSHDIRTPLAGIIGLASIVESESQEEEIREYAHMLNISGEQLLSLLNSVLDIVAANSIGQKSLRLTVFSLEDLLHNIFELEVPSLQLKSIDFKLHMDEALPTFVESDKEKLYRIVLNILSNAIKFTHDGSIIIKASSLGEKDGYMITKIEVIDTGIGIPKEDISKVFDQFYRANPAHEGKFDGYGVGLHIVRKYLSLLKGEVSVESEVGKGTSISLILPLKAATKPQNYKKPSVINFDGKSKTQYDEPSSKSKSSLDSNKTRVLIVEDNRMARIVAKSMLTKAGCTVIDAKNATEALKLFINNSFDFVLTDIGLPDFSGLELSKKMRRHAIQNHFAQVPVIVLSGHETKDNLDKYEFKYGIADIYTKPLRGNDLVEILNHYGKASKDMQKLDGSLDTSSEISQQSYLDVKLALKQLGTIEMVKEMAQLMLDDALVNIVPEIDEHYHSQNWKEFKSRVHKLKSSCLYCATIPLLELVQKLEELADEHDMKKIAPIYNEFLLVTSLTKAYIKFWLKKQS